MNKFRDTIPVRGPARIASRPVQPSRLSRLGLMLWPYVVAFAVGVAISVQW